MALGRRSNDDGALAYYPDRRLQWCLFTGDRPFINCHCFIFTRSSGYALYNAYVALMQNVSIHLSVI